MKAEKTTIITGKEYQHIKEHLQNNAYYEFSNGSMFSPETVKITEIYLDTDPDFTRNPKQFARVADDQNVQVKMVYEEAE